MRTIKEIAVDIINHVFQAIDDPTGISISFFIKDVADIMITIDEIAQCGTDAVSSLAQEALKSRLVAEDLSKTSGTGAGDISINLVISVADEKLHVFPFKDVATCWRRLYTDSSLLQAVNKALHPPDSEATGNDISTYHEDLLDPRDAWLDEIVKILDMVIIMTGAPGADRPELIAELLAALEVEYDPFDPASQDFGTSFRFPLISGSIDVHNPVQRMAAPSLDTFEKQILEPPNQDLGPTPLIITGALEHWPALEDHFWSSPNYLLSQTFSGRRLVPVETGRSYVSEGWGQRIISFRQYLDEYLMPKAESGTDSPLQPAGEIGYLAQHPLLTQLPSLRKDITIPDYCFIDPPGPLPASRTGQITSLTTAKLEEPLINAWLGPAHTTSPLHHDPYHNFLCQVVGRKYIRLYSPLETLKVYPRGNEDGIDMSNTSQVDVGAFVDRIKGSLDGFEKFFEAQYVDCVLEPGEMLYVPRGWWHYVRSLSTSFSVSFWWN